MVKYQVDSVKMTIFEVILPHRKGLRSRQLKSKQPTAKWGHVFSTKFGRKSKRDRAARIYYVNHTEWNFQCQKHTAQIYIQDRLKIVLKVTKMRALV